MCIWWVTAQIKWSMAEKADSGAGEAALIVTTTSKKGATNGRANTELLQN